MTKRLSKQIKKYLPKLGSRKWTHDNVRHEGKEGAKGR